MDTRFVIKYSGERVPFEIEKLQRSLTEAGALETTAARISDRVSEEIIDGTTTHEIYQKAHRMLRREERSKATRFHLKKAILNLGPTGYPFELFIGALMEKEGFRTQVGVVKKGRCISHEVDVWAERNNTLRLMECKFHNRPGYKTDVKVPLYIKSRFDDLISILDQDGAVHFEGWVATNGRFTSDAIQYAECVGLNPFSWDYPQHYNLKLLTRKYRLYPITALHGLNRRHTSQLMESGVVLLESLWKQPELLNTLDLSPKRRQKIIEEAEQVSRI